MMVSLKRSSLLLLCLVLLLGALFSACAPEPEPPSDAASGLVLGEDEEVVEGPLPEGKADAPSFELSPVEGFEPPESALIQEQRRTITTPAAFERLMGRPAPRGFDFSSRWMVFYAAGRQSTGGYTAQIEAVRLAPSNKSLQIATTLRSAGPGCNVTFAESTPYALVSFARPNLQQASVRYYASSQPEAACTPGATACDVDVTLDALAALGGELWFTSEGDEPLDMDVWGAAGTSLSDDVALRDLLQEPNVEAAVGFGGGEAAGVTARAEISDVALERVVRSLFIWRDGGVIELSEADQSALIASLYDTLGSDLRVIRVETFYKESLDATYERAVPRVHYYMLGQGPCGVFGFKAISIET